MSLVESIIQRRNKVRKEYALAHKFCPNCYSESYQTTLMGFILDLNSPETYKDENTIKCKCGWTGITHDLIGEYNG